MENQISRFSLRDTESAMKPKATTVKIFHAWYLKNYRLTWILNRVAVILGVEVWGLSAQHLPLAAIVGSSSVIGAACLATAALSIPLNNIQNKARVYGNKLTKEFVENNPDAWFSQYMVQKDEAGKPMFQQVEVRDDDLEGKVRVEEAPIFSRIGSGLDNLHGKANFYMIEAVFGVAIALGNQTVLDQLHIAHDPISWGVMALNTLYSTLSQGQWEEALGKLRKLSLASSVPLSRINARQSFLSALGSVLSVVGYTFANQTGALISLPHVIGYGVLAVLGSAGIVFSKQLGKKELVEVGQLLHQTQCNHDLTEGPRLGEI